MNYLQVMFQTTRRGSATGFRLSGIIFVATSLMAATGCTAPEEQRHGAEEKVNEVCFEGGEVVLGSTTHYPEEQPLRSLNVKPFCLDKFEVSVSRFRQFVQATGYRTVAETGPDPSDYPGQPTEYFQPGSAVFVFPTQIGPGHWSFNQSANWQDPEGTATSLVGIEKHPVTHIAYKDAQNYAKWLGRRLPTEAEWEYAAKRGGIVVDNEFDTESGKRRIVANVWDGEFPLFNTELDGYARTSPVGSFAPDANGVYDLLGNVWEWTVDSYDHESATGVKRHVIKGGSHLCATNFCARFRPEARQPQEQGLSTSHIGFRTSRSASD